MTNEEKLYERTIQLLHERGVQLSDIGELVMFLQERFIPKLTIEEATQNVRIVLRKREVQNAVMTGIALDKAAEANSLEEPLQKIIAEDEGLYGSMRCWPFQSSMFMDQLVLLITAILIGLSQEFWPAQCPRAGDHPHFS